MQDVDPSLSPAQRVIADAMNEKYLKLQTPQVLKCDVTYTGAVYIGIKYMQSYITYYVYVLMTI